MLNQYIETYQLMQPFEMKMDYIFESEPQRKKAGVTKTKKNTNYMIIYMAHLLLSHNLKIHKKFQVGSSSKLGEKGILMVAKKQLHNMRYGDADPKNRRYNSTATGKMSGNDDLAIALLWFVYYCKKDWVDKRRLISYMATKMNVGGVIPHL